LFKAVPEAHRTHHRKIMEDKIKKAALKEILRLRMN
jgi:hypothetical protein